ncbi:DsbA family oxidoreductase [Miniphocaeibacter massiliensis]|uniref:DsbA family oxidoreductase n=1 Tax=Miniphocaeibacter massiliensis TaxID=2041841 RepID=UPI000C1BE497|nr:DsbA family protein [Miniphocaeibacter massiliensis]
MKNIEIHVDVACPFSYAGGEKMIQFLEKNNAPLTNIRFRSFQLQPDDDNTKTNYLMNRFKTSGMNSVEEYKEFFARLIGDQIKSIGLDYNIETVISKNTIHAHMGLQYATMFGKQAEYFRKVTRGHFAEGKDYYDFNYLDAVLTELGLDVKDFHSREEEMKNLVAEDMKLAAERGVRSVPTFYQNGIVLAGTGSVEEFEKFMLD